MQRREAEKLSETALQQINDKKYETELTTAGVRTIYKYGVASAVKRSKWQSGEEREFQSIKLILWRNSKVPNWHFGDVLISNAK